VTRLLVVGRDVDGADKLGALGAEFDLRVLPWRDRSRSGALDYAFLPLRVARALRRFRPDAMLVQGAHESALALAGRRLAGTETKIVLDVHGDWRAPARLYGSPLRSLLAPAADRLALAALRHLRAPRRRVLAPQGLPESLPSLPAQRRLAPLDLPVRTILHTGLVELDGGSFALLLRASGTGFSLRSEEEQTALVEAFGRFLNALAEPIEIVIRSEPVELAPLLARLQEQADVLPVAALAQAARAHLRFLSELAAREGVRRREILLVLSTRAREKQGAQLELRRRAGEAQQLLRAAAVELRLLEGEQAAALLARALDPPGPPLGATLEGVVRAC
jgi:hypothetical protein